MGGESDVPGVGIILSVSAKCVLLIDPRTYCCLVDYSHEDIASWSHSFDSFALVVGKSVGGGGVGGGGGGGVQKSFFVTSQGKDIDDLMTVYHRHGASHVSTKDR